MGHTISNNTACIELQQSAINGCNTFSDTCTSVSGWVTLGVNLIAIPILTLAGEMLIEGVLDTAILVRDVRKSFHKSNRYQTIQDESQNNTQPIPFWKRALGSVRQLTTVTTLTSIALVTLKVGSLFTNSSCQSINEHCPQFGMHAVEVCNWSNQFLIDVINQIIAHHML